MQISKAFVTGILVFSSLSAAAAAHDSCAQGHAHHANWQASRDDRFAQHQAELHDALKLNAAQESAWQTYQTQVAPPRDESREDPQALRKLTTLQRLDKLDAWEKTRANQHAQRSLAIRTFYAQLNEAQKQVFDALAFAHHRGHVR